MVSGKRIVLALLFLGAALILGYDWVRRSATPEIASLVEDRGAAAGTFERVYRFREDRYLVRQEGGAPGSGARVLLARLDPAGGTSASVSLPIPGPLLEAHFLELERGGPPTVVAIASEAGGEERSSGFALHLGSPGGRAAALHPLPEELGRRYLGHDRYERQGAFLYRTLRLAPLDPKEEPVDTRLFYDFENERWVVSR